jgi:site-specific recombinase XerD
MSSNGSNSVQKAIRIAVQRAEIVENVAMYTSRHSFAVHLLMKGVKI